MNLWRDVDMELFTWLGAGSGPSELLPLAVWFAHWSGIGLLLVLTHAVATGRLRPSHLALCVLSALLAQLLAHALTRAWDAPRPFMLGLSPNHLEHGERGGFPSAHASVMFALAVALWLAGARRLHWLSATALAALTGWARVFAGAHFPLDVAGGAVLGLTVAWLCSVGHAAVIRAPSIFHRRFG